MAFSLATSKHCAEFFFPYQLLHSSPSHVTLVTIARRAGLWKCARVVSENPRTFSSAGARRSPVMHRLSINLRFSVEELPRMCCSHLQMSSRSLVRFLAQPTALGPIDVRSHLCSRCFTGYWWVSTRIQLGNAGTTLNLTIDAQAPTPS